MDREVAPFNPAHEFPERFQYNKYAASLGIAQAGQARPSTLLKLGKSWMPSVGVLSERHRVRRLPAVPTGIFVALLVLAWIAFAANGHAGGRGVGVRPKSRRLNGRLNGHNLSLAHLRATGLDVTPAEHA